MKISVTGANGKIGRHLVALGAYPLICDITKPSEVHAELQRVRPDVVIHAAAISSVDECENNYEKAVAVNCWGTNQVATLAEKVSAKVLLLSTEHVFDGRWGSYKESSTPKPVNNYGITKLAAEGIVQLYSGKVMRLSRCVRWSDPDIQQVISENIPCPTFIKRNYLHIRFAAEAIMRCAIRFESMPPVLHYGGEERISWYNFARRINPFVAKRRKEEPGHSPRPYNCGFNLSLAKRFGLPMYPIKRTISMLYEVGE
jgi:dTDP-4-dehydrorhamnose reductase